MTVAEKLCLQHVVSKTTPSFVQCNLAIKLLLLQLSYREKEVPSFSVQVSVVVCLHSLFNEHKILNLAPNSPGEAEQTGSEAEQLELGWALIDTPDPINQSDCSAAVSSLPRATVALRECSEKMQLVISSWAKKKERKKVAISSEGNTQWLSLFQGDQYRSLFLSHTCKQSQSEAITLRAFSKAQTLTMFSSWRFLTCCWHEETEQLA